MLRAFVNCAGKDRLTGTCQWCNAMVLTKCLNFLIFQLPKADKDHCALFDWLPTWQLKNKETLSEDGGRAKFAEKTPRLPI